jgi:hypothetical protein
VSSAVGRGSDPEVGRELSDITCASSRLVPSPARGADEPVKCSAVERASSSEARRDSSEMGRASSRDISLPFLSHGERETGRDALWPSSGHGAALFAPSAPAASAREAEGAVWFAALTNSEAAACFDSAALDAVPGAARGKNAPVLAVVSEGEPALVAVPIAARVEGDPELAAVSIAGDAPAAMRTSNLLGWYVPARRPLLCSASGVSQTGQRKLSNKTPRRAGAGRRAEKCHEGAAGRREGKQPSVSHEASTAGQRGAKREGATRSEHGGTARSEEKECQKKRGRRNSAAREGVRERERVPQEARTA